MPASIRSQVLEIAWDLFRTQGRLKLTEISAVLKKRGVELSPNNTVIRSTIYQMMKKDPRIQRKGRGEYEWLGKEDCKMGNAPEKDLSHGRCMPAKEAGPVDERIAYLDQTEKELLAILSQIENFNWLESANGEEIKMKQYWTRLKSLYANIGIKMQKIAKK